MAAGELYFHKNNTSVHTAVVKGWMVAQGFRIIEQMRNEHPPIYLTWLLQKFLFPTTKKRLAGKTLTQSPQS
jgi:hypothetical protein